MAIGYFSHMELKTTLNKYRDKAVWQCEAGIIEGIDQILNEIENEVQNWDCVEEECGANTVLVQLRKKLVINQENS
jgi:hypothetical protein